MMRHIDPGTSLYLRALIRLSEGRHVIIIPEPDAARFLSWTPEGRDVLYCTCPDDDVRAMYAVKAAQWAHDYIEQAGR